MAVHMDKKRFCSSELANLASNVGSEFHDAFQAYGATLKVAPHGFSRLFEVGEGFELWLAPNDPDTWSMSRCAATAENS